MAKKHSEEMEGNAKEFLDIFKGLCYARSAWEVWADVICAIACSLSNTADRMPGRYEEREKEYLQCIEHLGSVETVAKLFACITLALDKEPEQDFLGEMYMQLELGNHWKGQFFTPYNVCRCMAEINIGDGVKEEISKRGYVSVMDPACGAGATLIAAANTFKKREINYQTNVIFVAQDIDRIVGMMCYIQLSLLGCPGYVVIANTITNPVCGSSLVPTEKEGQEFWYTPFYFTEIWNSRRLLQSIGLYDIRVPAEEKTEIPQVIMEKASKEGFFFFGFEQEEVVNGWTE